MLLFLSPATVEGWCPVYCSKWLSCDNLDSWFGKTICSRWVGRKRSLSQHVCVPTRGWYCCNCDISKDAIFTEQRPFWQHLWSYRLMRCHKYSKLTDNLFFFYWCYSVTWRHSGSANIQYIYSNIQCVCTVVVSQAVVRSTCC